MNQKDLPFSVDNYLRAHADLLQRMDQAAVGEAIDLVYEKFQSGKKIITCGNGGSAATASHYITDWNKMINLATNKKFYGSCLNDNIGLITAYANDISYDEIFSGQLKSILDEGDLLVAISGSGNSKNILKAVEYANIVGASTLGIAGYDGGKLKRIASHCVWIPSFDMQLCEDFHLMFGHMVMKSLCAHSIRP